MYTDRINPDYPEGRLLVSSRGFELKDPSLPISAVPLDEKADKLLEYLELTMHHVRNLKSASLETEWGRKMLKMQRKTLAVCEKCNQRIHSYGK